MASATKASVTKYYIVTSTISRPPVPSATLQGCLSARRGCGTLPEPPSSEGLGGQSNILILEKEEALSLSLIVYWVRRIVLTVGVVGDIQCFEQ